MSDQNQRELAKQLAQQGDPKAIASAINHSLKPKGIIADVMRDNGCLHVMLEGEQVPNHQQALVKFVHNGMKKLEIQSVYSVKVYGRQFGEDLPAWEEEIVLQTLPEDELAGIEEILPSDSELESQQVPPPYSLDQDEDLDHEILSEEEDDIESDLDYVIEEDLVDDNLEEEDEEADVDYNPEEDDDFEDDIEEPVATDNKGKILLFVLGLILLTLAALAGLHFAGIYKLPFLSGVSSDSEVETQTPPESPTSSPSQETETPNSPEPTTAPPPPSEPWRDAVNKAGSAANLAQTAQAKAEWETVASEWQEAVELMQQVPESNPNHQTAQQKAIEYESYRQIALQNAERAAF